VFVNILDLQFIAMNCKEKKGYLPYPKFLITINILDSFGVVALQTFVLMSQV